MKKSIFENLNKIMEEDAKDPNGVLANFIKEREEIEIQKKEFYESERFNEIIDLFNSYEVSSVNSERLSYSDSVSDLKKIFNDMKEFYLFCDSIDLMNQDKSFSPDSYFTEYVTYYLNKYRVRTIHGQGSVTVFEKLEKPIKSIDKKVFGKCSENHEFGIVEIEEADGKIKIYPFGDKFEIIHSLYFKINED